MDITPQDYAAGKDPQLERALQEVLDLLDKSPPQIPAFDKKPNLALPKLPPRDG